MSKSVTVFAPATVANVGCAFDILGFAVSEPGDQIVLTLRDSAGISITKITGDSGKLPTDPSKNTAGVAVAALFDHLGITLGVDIEVHKKMPLGSGLGSSAASAAAAVFAANLALGTPLAPQELLPFAMEGERAACGVAHADNVAPALLGGFVLIRSYDPLEIIEISAPADLYCSIVYPIIELRTEDARKILKKEVLLQDAIIQWGNIAGLIVGLIRSDYQLIGRSLHDVIIEPERSVLVPGFDEIKRAALKAGALGCSLSGSGPSIFALTDSRPKAEAVGHTMQEEFHRLGIDAKLFASKVNAQGPIIIE